MAHTSFLTKPTQETHTHTQIHTRTHIYTLFRKRKSDNIKSIDQQSTLINHSSTSLWLVIKEKRAFHERKINIEKYHMNQSFSNQNDNGSQQTEMERELELAIRPVFKLPPATRRVQARGF